MAHALLNAAGQKIERPAGPTIEMTTVENVAARKFLQFALDDIKFQLEKLSKEKAVKKADFEDSKSGAILISAYIANLVHELDRAINTALGGSGSLQ